MRLRVLAPQLFFPLPGTPLAMRAVLELLATVLSQAQRQEFDPNHAAESTRGRERAAPPRRHLPVHQE